MHEVLSGMITWLTNFQLHPEFVEVVQTRKCGLRLENAVMPCTF